MEYDTTIDIPDDEFKELARDNFAIDDIFTNDDIIEYTKDGILIEDVYDESHILEYVRGNFSPDDIFPIDVLNNWAEANGFIKQ